MLQTIPSQQSTPSQAAPTTDRDIESNTTINASTLAKVKPQTPPSAVTSFETCVDPRKSSTGNAVNLTQHTQAGCSRKDWLQGIMIALCLGGTLCGALGGAAVAIIRKVEKNKDLDFGVRPIQILNCNEHDTEILITAHQSISNNLLALLSDEQVTLSDKNFNRFYDCFEYSDTSCLKYVCSDNLGSCQKNTTLGYYTGPANQNNEIYFCMANTRDYIQRNAFTENQLLCEFASTMAHECGHYLQVPTFANHNQGPNNDAVYRLGQASYTICMNT